MWEIQRIKKQRSNGARNMTPMKMHTDRVHGGGTDLFFAVNANRKLRKQRKETEETFAIRIMTSNMQTKENPRIT